MNTACHSSLIAFSLRGRRLKGMGKDVLGANEHEGARPNSLPRPFRTPATQAKLLWVRCQLVPTLRALKLISNFIFLQAFSAAFVSVNKVNELAR